MALGSAASTRLQARADLRYGAPRCRHRTRGTHGARDGGAEAAAARRARRSRPFCSSPLSSLVTLLLTAFGSGSARRRSRRRRPAPRRAAAAGRPAAAAGRGDAGRAPARAADRAEPRDGDRLPRAPATARSRSTRSGTRRNQGLVGAARPQALRRRRQRHPLLRSSSGGTGPRPRRSTSGAAPATDVYSPVDGTVVGITPVRARRQARTAPASTSSRRAAPSVVVSLTHLRADPSADGRLDGRRVDLEDRHGPRLLRGRAARRSRATRRTPATTSRCPVHTAAARRR